MCISACSNGIISERKKWLSVMKLYLTLLTSSLSFAHFFTNDYGKEHCGSFKGKNNKRAGHNEEYTWKTSMTMKVPFWCYKCLKLYYNEVSRWETTPKYISSCDHISRCYASEPQLFALYRNAGTKFWLAEVVIIVKATPKEWAIAESINLPFSVVNNKAFWSFSNH